MELLLIRHGLPERSEATADPPLAKEGHEQARSVARWLAEEPIAAVFASTMRRALQTAEPLAASLGCGLRTHPGIVEFDRGSGRYVPMEILKRDDYPAWQAFVADGYAADIGAFQKVVVEAIEGIIAEHPSKTVGVVCHGGVINVWTAHVLRMPPRLFFEPGYASIHRYLCAKSGERNVVSLNECAHLRRRA